MNTLAKHTKTLLAVIGAVLIVLAVSGMVVAQRAGARQTDKLIGEDMAKEIAYQDAGVKASDATLEKNLLTTEEGRQVYEVDFYDGTTEYDYEIDALEGTVYSKDRETMKVTGGAAEGKKSSPSAVSSPDSADFIGTERAKELALTAAGLSAQEVSFQKAKLDSDDGRVVYEVGFSVGTTEYDYDIDAVTGEIVSSEIDHEDMDDDYDDYEDDDDAYDD